MYVVIILGGDIILLPNQIIIVSNRGGNNKVRERYLEKGYEIQDGVFHIKAEDLSENSQKKVQVECDICHKIKEIPYVKYRTQVTEEFGYVCKECYSVKIKNTVLKKYGVDNVAKIPQNIEKARKTNVERYGKPSYAQTDEYKRRFEETCMERYGCKNPIYNDEVQKKIKKSLYENQTCATSSQQIVLYEMLKNIYGNCELNYPCGKYSLDCMIEVDGCKIDVEYDGWYWHKDKNKDIIRNRIVQKRGYKILRICSGELLPTEERLKYKIKNLVEDNKDLEAIVLDDWKNHK